MEQGLFVPDMLHHVYEEPPDWQEEHFALLLLALVLVVVVVTAAPVQLYTEAVFLLALRLAASLPFCLLDGEPVQLVLEAKLRQF